MTKETQTPEAQEEAAMQQRLAEIEAAGQQPALSISEAGGVGTEKVPSPLDTPEPAPAPEEPERKLFLGDWTDQDVINRLNRLDTLEEQLTSKLMGKLGPLGRELKALKEAQATEWEFDPSVLEPLKNLDEGIYDILTEGLKKGLKQTGNVRPFVEDLMKEQSIGMAAAFHDAVEERLIQALLPNYLDLSEEKEFGPWLKESQPSEIFQAFVDWDDEAAVGKKDATSLLKAYREYVEFKGQKEKEQSRKADTLKRSAVEAKGAPPPPARASVLSEEEAFQARLREIQENGLQLNS